MTRCISGWMRMPSFVYAAVAIGRSVSTPSFTATRTSVLLFSFFFCSLLLDQTFYFSLQPKQTYVCMHKYALTLRGRRIAFSILELIHIDTIPGYINISFSFYFFVRASARRGTKGADRFQPFYSSHGNDGALTVEVSECS